MFEVIEVVVVRYEVCVHRVTHSQSAVKLHVTTSRSVVRSHVNYE